MIETGVGGCGTGFHREHHDWVLAEHPAVPWFELISENFMVPGGRPRHVLERLRRDWPVALHGVSLSPGSDEPVDPGYLRRLKDLVSWVQPAIVSDHLCWTGLGGHNSHDLLPLPFTEEVVRTAAAKIRQFQDTLGRRILVENVSTYLRFDGSTMTEWEFVAAVAAEADCGILLDVNNVFVNSRNHGFDPAEYLAALPVDRVAQFHIAGHEEHGQVVLDTHDRPVDTAVWDLFRRAVARFGPRPAIIERDEHIPEFPVLLDEIRQAQRILDGAPD